MKRQQGFTLFELLVSISIVGILTALAIVSFSGAQKKGRDARRIEDMKLVQSAAEQFYAINNYSYPLGTNAPNQWTTSTGQVVLERFPVDPKPGGTAYGCRTIGADAYCCCAYMENTNSGNSSDNNCTWASSGQYYCVKNQQ
jgi:prepilin-type N-terminal cleavage/methylation domain-containing protein